MGDNFNFGSAIVSAAIPDAVWQVVIQVNTSVLAVHSGHDGSGQRAVDPQAGTDLSRRRAQRGLQGGDIATWRKGAVKTAEIKPAAVTCS